MKCAAFTRPVLLVEDNLDDALFFQRAFRAAGFQNPLHTLHTGEEVLRYLRGEGDYSNRSNHPLPHLVVVAPNMQPVSGWEVLEWIRKTRGYGSMHVVILGGDGSPSDQEKAARLNANACHAKPTTNDELQALIRRIADFWLLGGASNGSGG